MCYFYLFQEIVIIVIKANLGEGAAVMATPTITLGIVTAHIEMENLEVPMVSTFSNVVH